MPMTELEMYQILADDGRKKIVFISGCPSYF
jgi:hypothetical protein